MDDFDLAVRFERLDRATRYLLEREQDAQRAAGMDTAEVDAHLEALTP